LPWEWVNIFITGLDPSYNKAVSQLHASMDNWENHDDLGPDNLKVSKLLNLMEKYMCAD
jgi:hypothetical protein